MVLRGSCMMSVRTFAATLGAAALLGAMLAAPSVGQQRPAPAAPAAPAKPAPTPAAMLLAKEMIDLKGAASAYDPLVNGVIQYHRNFFMQTNPNLARDLEAVEQKLAGAH